MYTKPLLKTSEEDIKIYRETYRKIMNLDNEYLYLELLRDDPVYKTAKCLIGGLGTVAGYSILAKKYDTGLYAGVDVLLLFLLFYCKNSPGTEYGFLLTNPKPASERQILEWELLVSKYLFLLRSSISSVTLETFINEDISNGIIPEFQRKECHDALQRAMHMYPYQPRINPEYFEQDPNQFTKMKVRNQITKNYLV